jgi:hypothetical protein
MTKIILSAACLFSCYCTQLSAQDYNFNEFKYPTIDLKGMTINGSSDIGNNNFINSSLINPSGILFRDRYFGLSLNADLNYFTLTNNEKTQGNSSLIPFFSTNFYQRIDSPDSILVDEQKNYYFNVFYTSTKRTYHNPKTYIEWGLKGNSILHYIKNEVDFTQGGSIDDLKESQHVILSMPLRMGKGRIEPISTVFLANFIMEELKEQGIISDPISQDSLFALGRLVASVFNTRIFDSRVLKKEQLRQINKWLKSQSRGVAIDDLELYLIIQDNIFSSFFSNRNSGNRLSFGIEPEINYTNSNKFGSSINYSVIVDGKYEKEKALSKKSQIVNSITLGSSFQKFEDVSSIRIRPFVDGQISYGFYPNSRTISNLSLGLNAQYLLNDEINDTKFSTNYYLKYNINYFVNYRMRLFGNASFYRTASYLKQNDFIISGGMVYNIF